MKIALPKYSYVKFSFKLNRGHALKLKIGVLILSLVLAESCISAVDNSESEATADYVLDRTILPIHPPVTEIEARKVQKPEIFEVKAPDDAPNIVVVLLDDIGFGASSTFGSVPGRIGSRS